MSQTPSSSSDLQAIFNASIKEYQKKTKKDLLLHPLMGQLQTCDSPADIMGVLRTQVQQFEQSTSGDDKLTKWLIPTVNVLYAFSGALGEGVGLVFSPAKVIFAGAGVFLLAAKDFAASQEACIDIFERIESFFRRLEEYSEVPTTEAMKDIIVKIMVEVLGIFGVVTKEMTQGRRCQLEEGISKTRSADWIIDATGADADCADAENHIMSRTDGNCWRQCQCGY